LFIISWQRAVISSSVRGRDGSAEVRVEAATLDEGAEVVAECWERRELRREASAPE
jgi:hypothetical protein